MVTRRLFKVAGLILARWPRLLKLALSLRLSLQFKLWRLQVSIRSRRWAENPDANRTYWVDPDRIQCACVFDKLEDWNKYRYRGKVIGGNWDLRRVKFTERFGLYRMLEDRFIRGMRWEETQFYQRVLDLISNGTPSWRCKNKVELDERCGYLDCLFQEIKNNGFRPQSEIAQAENDPYRVEDEITVRIARDGALLFEDGQHRLAVAKLLHIDRVPIKINARHLEWHQFRREILYYARTQGGRVYHALTHPDLSDIPSLYGEETFELIKAHLPVQSGDLLDIGAH